MPRCGEAQLARFLQRAASRRFVIGEHDCGLWIADWCLEVTGQDPAASWRGRFSTPEELAALTGPRGVQLAFSRELKRIGLKRTRAMQTGDIALVSIGGAPLVGAIIYSPRAIVLAEGGGLSSAPVSAMRIIAAWSLNG